MFLFLFHFSWIGTSHLLNCFLFDVNCAIMLSFCLPLMLSFLQSSHSFNSYFYHLFRFCLHCLLSSPHLRFVPSYTVTYRFEFTFDEVLLFHSCGIRSFMQSAPLIRLNYLLDLPFQCALFYFLLSLFQICTLMEYSIFS